MVYVTAMSDYLTSNETATRLGMPVQSLRHHEIMHDQG